MIKYFYVENEPYVYSLDEDSENIKRIDNFYADHMYYVPEDGELTYTKKDGSRVKRSVAKGTLVLSMYSISRGANKELIFVENDELRNYYSRLIEYKQKQKEARDNQTMRSDCDSECICKPDC